MLPNTKKNNLLVDIIISITALAVFVDKTKHSFLIGLTASFIFVIVKTYENIKASLGINKNSLL